jgi:predicted phosphodiesterase
VRVAVLYDIHGNLPALEAVLEEVRRIGVDQIIVGGDVVPGPMPRETLAALRHLSIPAQFILGNGEVAVMAEMTGCAVAVPEQYRGVIRWNAQQLEPEGPEWFAEWPKTLRMNIAPIGDVLFCHATPRNENEIFLRTTAEARLLPVFASVEAALVVCGHTHMQFDRMVGSVRVVNAGSVGMPFGEPGADWLLLGPDVELRHTNYDLADAARRIRATQYPQAEDFAANNVLQPPSEAKMLELFARAELK